MATPSIVEGVVVDPFDGGAAKFDLRAVGDQPDGIARTFQVAGGVAEFDPIAKVAMWQRSDFEPY